MSTAENLRAITFKIEPDVYEALLTLAREDDRSVSALLRFAARDYLAGRNASPTSREDAA